MSSTDIKKLQESLRNSLGDDVRVSKLPNHDFYRVEVPFYFPDGDPYQIYVEMLGDNILRLSDKGHQLMQMSYEMDIDLLFKGKRDRIRTQILREFGISEDRGEFYLISQVSKLSESIFKFGQALTRIYDLLLLNPENGSHDDLWEAVANIASRNEPQKERQAETVYEKSGGAYMKNEKRPSPRHQWDGNDKPKLDDHSEAKHRLLSSYIQKYLSIVCKNPRMDKFNLALVDGFAGGGRYQDDKPGSPLVMIEAVERARIDLNENRRKPISINPSYFFVEQDPGNFAALKKEFSDNTHSPSLFEGDFNEHLVRIVYDIQRTNPRKGGGAIFFLDQEGYTAIKMRTLNYIQRELPQSEIILTFAISSLVDFISEPESLYRLINGIGLRYLNIDEICDTKDDIVDRRNIVESKFSEAIFKSTSFKYYRTFFIQPHNNHRGYWLLHLSQHPRAQTAMTETTWNVGNRVRHYGGVGTSLYELYYKGGNRELPWHFGKTFTDEAWSEHRGSLVTDLARIVWEHETITVRRLIKDTCNDTAAPPEMYLEALSNNDEIVVLGKLGGKKRSEKVSLSDTLAPRRQKFLMPF